MEELKNNNTYTTDDNDNQIENVSLIKPSTTDHPLYNNVVEACKTVFDPEIPVNIFELGLIYKIEIDNEKNVAIEMTLTSPNCPVAESLPNSVRDNILKIDGIKDVKLKLVWDPPWTKEKMSESAKLELNL